MIRNVVLVRMPEDADAAAYAVLEAGLRGIAALDLPGLRHMSVGRDAALRAGGWSAAIVNDWADADAYRGYDLDEEHNVHRSAIVEVAEQVARVQYEVVGPRAHSPLRVVRPEALEPADPTPGMARSRAFESGPLWAGQVVTEPGAVSGWHHHDVNETSIYVVSGVMRLEFEGEPGHLEARAGDFVHVPAHTVHRESNPGTQPCVAVLARSGGGVPTVNVAEPPRQPR